MKGHISLNERMKKFLAQTKKKDKPTGWLQWLKKLLAKLTLAVLSLFLISCARHAKSAPLPQPPAAPAPAVAEAQKPAALKPLTSADWLVRNCKPDASGTACRCYRPQTRIDVKSKDKHRIIECR